MASGSSGVLYCASRKPSSSREPISARASAALSSARRAIMNTSAVDGALRSVELADHVRRRNGGAQIRDDGPGEVAPH